MDASTAVMWLPAEFWAFSVSMGGGTDEEVEEVLEVLSPYTLFLVTDGTIGVFGGVTNKSTDELVASVTLVSPDGALVRPLADSELSADMGSFVRNVVPLFLTELMGNFAENYVAVVFPGETITSGRLADSTVDGSVTLNVGERSFRWRTPIGGLVPPKYCPVDGERLSGGWRYCPWHGAELEDHP
jgi:hypothetical protein